MQCNENTHHDWMSQAVSFASEVKDEVPISALIVKNNILISKAVNQIEALNDSTAHAEILAIREASRKLGDWRLNDCTLYTTLEPCAMCAGAIINSRVSKIVFGAYDKDFGVCGSKINLFFELEKQNQIEVVGGILEIEISQLLKEFFAVRRSRF